MQQKQNSSNQISFSPRLSTLVRHWFQLLTSAHRPYTVKSTKSEHRSIPWSLIERADRWQVFLAERKIMLQSWPIYNTDLQ